MARLMAIADDYWRALSVLRFHAAPRDLCFERGDYFHGDPLIYRMEQREDGKVAVTGYSEQELSELAHG